MRKTYIALPVVLLVLIISLSASAATPVSGTITTNTTWTRAESPYVATGDLIVGSGATLTIEPGVVVQFQRIDAPKSYTNRGVLRVMGQLSAVGTSGMPIKFTLEQGTALGEWGGLWIDGGTADLEYIDVSYAVRGVYASDSSIRLRHSNLSMNMTGVHLEGGANHLISYNQISRNQYGVFADQVGGSLDHNRIISNSWGLYNQAEQGFHVRHNDFKSNTFGVVHDGGTTSIIELNDFSISRANDYALLVRRDHPALITHNNFFYDAQLAQSPGTVFWHVFHEGPDDLQAPNNWWDTIDSAVIDEYTYEHKDDPALGRLLYSPIAMAPVADTTSGTYPLEISAWVGDPCSPNGDGVQDECSLFYSLSKDAAVTVAVLDTAGLVGPSGGVLWRVDAGTVKAGGTESVVWNGMANGSLVPAGNYTMTVQAIAGKESVQMEKGVVVDLTPPQLSLTNPAAGGLVHTVAWQLAGQVSDAQAPLNRLRVEVGTVQLPLTPEGDLDLFDYQLWLQPGVNTVTVTATDWAGNRQEQSVDLEFDPWITIQVPAETNNSGVVAQGEVVGGAVAQAVVTVRYPDESSAEVAAEITAGAPSTWMSSGPVPLRPGGNVVVVTGYDAAGTAISSNAAAVNYDPYRDQTLQHTFAPGVSLVTVPIIADSSDPAVVLGLGAGNDFDIARWQVVNGASSYVRYSSDASQITPMGPGVGYWLSLDEAAYPGGHTVDFQGDLAGPVPFKITVPRGWSLIGNPFLTAVPWHSVQVQADGGQPMSWEDAVRAGWLHASLWGYDGGSYRMRSDLQPWEGAWVKATRPLDLLIPPPGMGAAAFSITGDLPSAATGQPAVKKPAAGEWRLQLVVEAGQTHDVENFMGVSSGASAAIDPLLDWEEPPPVGDEQAMLSFVGPAGEALASDIRMVALGNGETWKATVQAKGNSPVRLSWPNVTSMPAGLQVALVDEQEKTRIVLRPGDSYTYWPAAQGELRTFSFEVSETAQLAAPSLAVYPNPWRGSGTVKVRVDVPVTGEAVQVSGAIYTAMGQLVRRVAGVGNGSEPLVLNWDGRSRYGQVVPNGLYEVRMWISVGDKREMVEERFVVWK